MPWSSPGVSREFEGRQSWCLRKDYLNRDIKIKIELCSRKISREKRLNNLGYAES